MDVRTLIYFNLKLSEFIRLDHFKPNALNMRKIGREKRKRDIVCVIPTNFLPRSSSLPVFFFIPLFPRGKCDGATARVPFSGQIPYSMFHNYPTGLNTLDYLVQCILLLGEVQLDMRHTVGMQLPYTYRRMGKNATQKC